MPETITPDAAPAVLKGFVKPLIFPNEFVPKNVAYPTAGTVSIPPMATPKNTADNIAIFISLV